MKKERTVIHVQFLATNEHHYFGSIANVYEFFSSEQIGISYPSLRNYGLSQEHPYENKRVIIRKGKLLSKLSKVSNDQQEE